MTHFDLDDDDLVRSLIALLHKHLPGDFTSNEDRSHARGFMLFASTEWAAWNHGNELAQIERLRAALREAQKAWRQIHDSLRFGMYQDASRRSENIAAGPESPLTMLLTLEHIFDRLEPSIRAGAAKVSRGKALGRTNWPAVQAAYGSRVVWHWRTGGRAPRAATAASPFGKFLGDILDLFEIDADPESAMNAWRRELIEAPKKST